MKTGIALHHRPAPGLRSIALPKAFAALGRGIKGEISGIFIVPGSMTPTPHRAVCRLHRTSDCQVFSQYARPSGCDPEMKPSTPEKPAAFIVALEPFVRSKAVGVLPLPEQGVAAAAARRMTIDRGIFGL